MSGCGLLLLSGYLAGVAYWIVRLRPGTAEWSELPPLSVMVVANVLGIVGLALLLSGLAGRLPRPFARAKGRIDSDDEHDAT